MGQRRRAAIRRPLLLACAGLAGVALFVIVGLALPVLLSRVRRDWVVVAAAAGTAGALLVGLESLV